jgi:hypothetical protein
LLRLHRSNNELFQLAKLPFGAAIFGTHVHISPLAKFSLFLAENRPHPVYSQKDKQVYTPAGHIPVCM